MEPAIGVLLERANPQAGDLASQDHWYAEVRLPALREAAGGASLRLAPREAADDARVAVVDVVGRSVPEALAIARAGLDTQAAERFGLALFGYELIFHAGRSERPTEARSVLVAQT